VARLFRDRLGEKAMLARFGGDEFAVLLTNTGEADVSATAKNLCSSLKENELAESGKTFTLNCHFGVVMFGKDAPSAQKVLADAYRAAQAMAAQDEPRQPAPVRAPTPATEPAKQAAQAPVAAPTIPTATPVAKPLSVDDDAGAHLWSTRIQTALDKNAFELFYQPIVNLHGDPAEYFEVLVRMRGEDNRPIPAGQFMIAAERAGLATAIDRWVVQRAIEALRELHGEKRKATFFVNLSPSSFREPDLIVQTQKHLRAMGLKPKYLSFEADEAALLAAPAEARAFLQAVRTLGCRFTVDNFGNNMNNLNQLRDLPIDCIKIAGEHIRDLANDNVAQTSLKALIQVAKAMDKQIIAKSVEKAEDLATLWNLNVDYVQGNYFQEANSGLSYDFGTETISTGDDSPRWASR
jgi:EAL domain-containing protein (putative c-di-GMP-specific phosphodiesterase class I)